MQKTTLCYNLSVTEVLCQRARLDFFSILQYVPRKYIIKDTFRDIGDTLTETSYRYSILVYTRHIYVYIRVCVL